MGKLTLSLSNDMGRESIVVLMLLNSTSPALIVLPQPRLFQALQGGFHDVLPVEPSYWGFELMARALQRVSVPLVAPFCILLL